MKKISGLLAAILVFIAAATAIGPVKEVQAFSSNEVDYSDFEWYYSSKAGSTIYFSIWLETDPIDVTGWKAALCPQDDITLSGAVVAFDLSNDNKRSYSGGSAEIYLNTVLPSDISEGVYSKAVFDADGNVIKSYSADMYINKSLLSFGCSLIDNDGYAYAYVYADNVPLNADTYPTLYAADKTTAVTSFNDYTTEVNENGDLVHVYKLNILDASEFAMNSDTSTCLYYKVGTPNVTVSGNDASNDGGYGLFQSDLNGFGVIYVGIVDNSAADNNTNNAEEDEEDEEEEEADTQWASAALNGQQIEVAVRGVQSSDVPAIQSATDNLVKWAAQIESQSADVVKILKQYAPSMNVTGVTSGGVLDLTIPSGEDISAGARITFADSSIAANVRSGDKVVVLHVKHDGTIEYLPAVAGDGNITATFNSLSPVAWFKVETSGTANGVSPKTGVSFWSFLLGLFR